MARVTSRDVARAAGVSQTTVSFVLNGKDEHGISEETRRAVLEVAERLGYVPSGPGRALRTGRSNIVLCVIPDFPVAEAMEKFKLELGRLLAEAGFTCVFVHRAGTAGPLADVWQHVQPAVVVGFGSLAEADVTQLRQARIPLLDGLFDPDHTTLAGLDQEAVGRLQVEHLAELGHRHLGYAALSDPRERPFCTPRLRGATLACRELGLPAPRVVHLPYSRDSARAAVATWAGSDPPVTAVAAFNDLLALAVLASCRTEGVPVPAGLAVVGVDDLPIASLAVPALTTIAMDLTVVATTLSAQILTLAGKPPHPATPGSTTVLRLVRRETT